MAKIDFKKELKQFYSAKQTPVMVTVPPMNFIMVGGTGDPNTSQDFADGVEALYGTAYTLKFAMKTDQPAGYFEFVVPPMQGLWWMDPGPFDPNAKDKWQWTVMIMQPDFVTKDMIANAVTALKAKKNPPAADKIHYESYDEGLAVQILHVGPYAQEGPTIQKLHAFAKENGCKLRGKHHEIYLSDPRKTAPEKLKTIIRQPVTRL